MRQREKRSSGKWIVFFILVAALAYMNREALLSPNPALQDTGNQPSSNIVSRSPAIIEQTVVATRVTWLDVTPTPYPTFTPYPTYTPQATLEPIIIVPTPIVINVAGNYGAGGKYDQMAELWIPRILAVILLLLVPFGGIYVWYVLKSNQQKMKHEEAMLAMEIARIENAPPKRNLIVNTARNRPNNDDYINTSAGDKILKEKVLEFIVNVRDIGLSINRWKESNTSIHQGDIEKILDHLEAVGLITGRSNGIAATWKKEVDLLRLSRYLGVSQEELANYKDNNKPEEEEEEELVEETSVEANYNDTEYDNRFEDIEE